MKNDHSLLSKLIRVARRTAFGPIAASLIATGLIACSGTIGKMREESERAAATRVAKWQERKQKNRAAQPANGNRSPGIERTVEPLPSNPAPRPDNPPEHPEKTREFQDFVKTLRKAVKKRDAVTIAAMMTRDFGYNLTPVMAGPGVFEFWDRNNLWDELDRVVRSEFRMFNGYMVAPPQFADPTQPYAGYRAGIRYTSGGWRFAYFVTGI